MENIAELKRVTKTYGGKTAVDDVSFVIPRGCVTAVLGPNGAGKTTTLSMMLGLREPSQGTVTLFGLSPKEAEVRRRIGAMLQEVSVIDGLKVHEVMAMIRSYYPKPLKLSEMADLAGFAPEELNKRASKLSGGQKRRLGFALAMAKRPGSAVFRRTDGRTRLHVAAGVLAAGPGTGPKGKNDIVFHALFAGGGGRRRPDFAVQQGKNRGRRHP